MNATVYLFGEFNNGYTQYPEDYAAAVFHEFHTNAKSTTQIVIHRDGSLMYYGYLRKLEQERYIGLCVVLNGMMLTDLDGLFLLYENTISNLVARGKLIHFNELGGIVTNVDRLYMNSEEIGSLAQFLRAGFDRLEGSTQLLPAVNYGMSKDSIKYCSMEDNINGIIKCSHVYGYTYINKSKGFNTYELNSYQEILARLNNEKIELAKQHNELAKEYKKVLKQKKQYRIVIILFFLVLTCAVSLLFLNDNLSNTKHALVNANDTIDLQKGSLSSKNSQIVSLQEQKRTLEIKYEREQSLRQKAESNLESLRGNIEERQPFIVKGTSFDFSTGRLSFSYYGVKEQSFKIQVRASNNDGYACSNSDDMDVYLGDHTYTIYLSRSLDNQKWYSFEILNENVILGGGRH